MYGVPVRVRAIFVAVGVLAAASATAGEPDDFRLRYFGADIEREGRRPDGPVIKVKFGGGSTFTYRAIAELKNFTGLRELTLSGVSVRTGLFDAIRGMKDLEVFNMPNAPNDAEFAVVAGMPKLRELSVVAVGFGPGVTDDGVKALRDLKEMRQAAAMVEECDGRRGEAHSRADETDGIGTGQYEGHGCKYPAAGHFDRTGTLGPHFH